MRKRKYTSTQKSVGWKQAYKIIAEKYGYDTADKLFDEASDLFAKYSTRYNNERGVRKGHVMGAVATASLYIPLSYLVGQEAAVDYIAESMKPASVAKHNKIEKFPAPVFMRIAGFISTRIFSEKAGFKRRWLCNTNHEKRYDLLTCPYVQVFSDLGCPEVCLAVCIQDDISFRNLKNGVVFERRGTLGRGDECCDFYFKRQV